MTTVFIAGSITIKHLDIEVQERIMNIVHQNFDVIVGDADGVDRSIQQFLLDVNYASVTVFCTGETPRNNVGNWPVNSVKSYSKPGSRAYFTAKDVAMAKVADSGLMIWDTKSTGTLSNVITLLEDKKFSRIFINKLNTFHVVKNMETLDALLTFMSPPARLKAESKISLNERMAALRSREMQMALLAERAEAA